MEVAQTQSRHSPAKQGAGRSPRSGARATSLRQIAVTIPPSFVSVVDFSNRHSCKSPQRCTSHHVLTNIPTWRLQLPKALHDVTLLCLSCVVLFVRAKNDSSFNTTIKFTYAYIPNDNANITQLQMKRFFNNHYPFQEPSVMLSSVFSWRRHELCGWTVRNCRIAGSS